MDSCSIRSTHSIFTQKKKILKSFLDGQFSNKKKEKKRHKGRIRAQNLSKKHQSRSEDVFKLQITRSSRKSTHLQGHKHKKVIAWGRKKTATKECSKSTNTLRETTKQFSNAL
jgi:hypothetical protein